jgi:hypothetical protein
LSCSVLCSELIVSHDCDILYDDSPSHFHLFVFVCRIEMSIIPLQTKIDFITDVVILSFGVPAPFTLTPNADVERSRNDWIRAQIDEVFPNLTQPLKRRLMLLSNTIHTLEKAEEKLQVLFQQGDFIFFHFFAFFLLTSLKFDLFPILQLNFSNQHKVNYFFVSFLFSFLISHSISLWL